MNEMMMERKKGPLVGARHDKQGIVVRNYYLDANNYDGATGHIGRKLPDKQLLLWL